MLKPGTFLHVLFSNYGLASQTANDGKFQTADEDALLIVEDNELLDWKLPWRKILELW